MKTLVISLLLCVALFAGGCAKQQESYQQAVLQTNEMALASIESQVKSNAERRQQSMVYFSQAMSQAAKTPAATDDVVISFAWGFSSGTPDTVEMPKIKFPERPSDGVDYMKAGVPYFGFVWPWLVGAYGGSERTSGDSQKIVATDQAQIYLDSGNAGSYNTESTVEGANAYNSPWNNIQPMNAEGSYENDFGATGAGTDGEVPEELTEEWCNEQGLTLRESTGECITYEYKSNIENSRLVGDE